MILLKYLGKSVGTQTFYGPATGRQYRFGKNPKHLIQPVEPEDVQTGSNRKPGFLEIRESGQRIFKVVQPTIIPKASETPHAAEVVAFGGNTSTVPSDYDADKEAAKIAAEMESIAKVETLSISIQAKKLAEELGVSSEDLTTYVTGTGKDNKITVKDVREYADA